MPRGHSSDWLYADVGREMLQWVRHGATLEIAASLCGVSESQLNDWYRLAAQKPDSPMGELIKDLREAEAVITNGHSRTGNIYGSNGQGPTSLVRWDD